MRTILLTSEKQDGTIFKSRLTLLNNKLFINDIEASFYGKHPLFLDYLIDDHLHRIEKSSYDLLNSMPNWLLTSGDGEYHAYSTPTKFGIFYINKTKNDSNDEIIQASIVMNDGVSYSSPDFLNSDEAFYEAQSWILEKTREIDLDPYIASYDAIREKTDSEDFNTLFKLDVDLYHHWISPVIRPINHIKVDSVIEFIINTPFCIFIKDGIYSITEADIIITYCFSRIEYTEKDLILSEDNNGINKYSSKIEMMYFSNINASIFDEESLSIYFDRCIDGLNDIIKSYFLATNDIHAHELSLFDINTISPYRIIDIHSWNVISHGLFLVNMHKTYVRDDLSQQESEEMSRHLGIIRGEKNPFLLSLEFLIKSQRYIMYGEYQEAVIYAQMAIEAFLGTLFIEILILEGNTREEAEEAKSRIAFMTMLKTGLHTRLGGNWDIEGSGKAGLWNKQTYMIRNRIIHSGYKVNKELALSSLSAANDFIIYVTALVMSKKKKYPTLHHYFHSIDRSMQKSSPKKS